MEPARSASLRVSVPRFIDGSNASSAGRRIPGLHRIVSIISSFTVAFTVPALLAKLPFGSASVAPSPTMASGAASILAWMSPGSPALTSHTGGMPHSATSCRCRGSSGMSSRPLPARSRAGQGCSCACTPDNARFSRRKDAISHPPNTANAPRDINHSASRISSHLRYFFI